ncbi:MAG TPA: peptidoglycan-binding domain-containing protein [Candidatus Paceibacterota bacterium]|nr:peptidoglycan-binding domain-containing protein [Candidatus Paceibacterota bacterium]
MNSKKLVSVALTATTLVWALGIAALPLANAQSTSDLQAQIAALLAQIQQLQSQLNASTGSTTTSSMTYDFTTDLTIGSTGAEVTQLQQFLISGGYLTAVSAPTGYFGTLTQAAVSAFQAANGITPTAGYFGPKTRAFINAMSTTSTGTGTTTGTTGTTVPATGLSVSVASTNPAAGSLVTSASGNTAAARIPILAISLTASNSGAVTVSQINVHKNGVLSDASINGAYLIQNGQVLYQYNSLSSGVISFSGMNLSVPAGQTVTLQVAIDPAPGLSPGNTVSFSVNSASDITAFDVNNNSLTPSGSFPLNGNTFTATTVSNPPVAGLTIQSSSIATQVTAGTQNNIVWAGTFNGQNSLTWLEGLNFTVIGSASNGDIRNVKLFVNGTQVGPTLATVSQNGTAYFNLASAPASLSTGNNNVQVYADVMGSPNKNFQFEILNSYDVNAVDSQYNVPIAVTLGSGLNNQTAYEVMIQQGQITVSQDSGTPTGNIAVGQSGVTIAKFDVYAAGEPVKVKFLGFQLSLTGVATSSGATSIGSFVKNIALVDDAGGQVGSTINTPPSSNSCDNTTGLSGYSTTSAGQSTITASTVNYVDCFGTSGSPINYIIPANTTRVLSLKADIQSLPAGATFGSVVGSLLTESGNLQGMISNAQSNSSGAQGSSLSLQSSLLGVTANSAYGSQTVTPNTSGAHIGSYAFTASSASGVTINTLSLKVYPNTVSNAETSDIQNLKVMVNGAQFGNTYGVVPDNGTYSFSGTAFTVPAGGTTYVDVYGDILSSATSSASIPTSPAGATQITGCSGTSIVSYGSVSCTATPVGQQLTIATQGNTQVSIGLDSSAPASSQLVMGSTGNTLAAYRLSETSNIEPVKVTDLTISQVTSATTSAYQNVTLYNGSTVVGTSGSASSTGTGFTYTFHFATPVIIPQANSLTLSLKGDIASYNSIGSTGVDDTTSTFNLATSSITALGASSNFPVTNVSGGATGNTMTVLRTTLTPSATALGNTTGRTKSAVDSLANITFTANSAGSAMLKNLTLNFTGSAVSSSAFAADVNLLDQNNLDVVANDNATVTSTSCSSTGACTLIWTFNTTSTPFVVSGGSSYVFTLRLNDTANGVGVATGNASVSLGVTIQNTTSTQYYDAGQASGASTVSLPTTLVPLNVNSITFAQNS